ncbi:hypothetical protein C8R47DRAFT_1196661 [Mycena vitilis]|nr:hypothetical protein C8R47DRAFT_1196661 [Mycena vitilis]
MTQLDPEALGCPASAEIPAFTSPSLEAGHPKASGSSWVIGVAQDRPFRRASNAGEVRESWGLVRALGSNSEGVRYLEPSKPRDVVDRLETRKFIEISGKGLQAWKRLSSEKYGQKLQFPLGPDQNSSLFSSFLENHQERRGVVAVLRDDLGHPHWEHSHQRALSVVCDDEQKNPGIHHTPPRTGASRGVPRTVRMAPAQQTFEVRMAPAQQTFEVGNAPKNDHATGYCPPKIRLNATVRTLQRETDDALKQGRKWKMRGSYSGALRCIQCARRAKDVQDRAALPGTQLKQQQQRDRAYDAGLG